MSSLINNIKILREISGAGFLDCKNALETNNNNIEESKDYLRKKGLSKANKKSSRDANEGVVGVFLDSDKTILLEINTETDFAAKNEFFLDFIEKIANFALNYKMQTNQLALNKFLETKFENRKISEYFTDIISSIGENIILKRIECITQDSNTKIFSYTHNKYRNNIGKICVALKAEIDTNNEDVKEFGKNLCMHIAASKPLSIDISDLDTKLIEKEKNIQLESIKSSNKPENIINKILEGKMNKFYSEVTLLNQNYIRDNEKTIRDIVKDFNKNIGKFNIIEYSLYVLGSE